MAPDEQRAIESDVRKPLLMGCFQFISLLALVAATCRTVGDSAVSPWFGQSSTSLDLERGPVQAVRAYFYVDALHTVPGGSFCHANAAKILRRAWSSGRPRFEACGMIEKAERDTMWLPGDFRT